MDGILLSLLASFGLGVSYTLQEKSITKWCSTFWFLTPAFLQESGRTISNNPNMHLHGHLKEVLLDYGPVYTF